MDDFCTGWLKVYLQNPIASYYKKDGSYLWKLCHTMLSDVIRCNLSLISVGLCKFPYKLVFKSKVLPDIYVQLTVFISSLWAKFDPRQGWCHPHQIGRVFNNGWLLAYFGQFSFANDSTQPAFWPTFSTVKFVFWFWHR
jgi:hypothetical protein